MTAHDLTHTVATASICYLVTVAGGTRREIAWRAALTAAGLPVRRHRHRHIDLTVVAHVGWDDHDWHDAGTATSQHGLRPTGVVRTCLPQRHPRPRTEVATDIPAMFATAGTAELAPIDRLRIAAPAWTRTPSRASPPGPASRPDPLRTRRRASMSGHLEYPADLVDILRGLTDDAMTPLDLIDDSVVIDVAAAFVDLLLHGAAAGVDPDRLDPATKSTTGRILHIALARKLIRAASH